ncbi:efflux RND transporter periplasmic adaptor subunit [Rheinheimera sp. 1928-s]|uniref:efflux RND transporter periplasmic adaptor subunit n=1 Tax=Rheinheimera sp. 1928-s TaxID=3033803 RepID=UPI0026253231|nr:efflux RND transporter periplasmic adaptor subunit [Rheinheimera sp. 1928-s]MDF3127151.1 efflux RND transporter periplasmic adaptor subunit [Rheinheimera sp. 1928-s]
MKTIKMTFIALCITSTLVACSKPEVAATVEATAKPLQLVSQDLLTLTESTLARGPVISGSLQPVVKAELNAEVSGIVMQVLKDNGDLVKTGDVLVKLDQTTYRDKLLSAQEAERSAVVTLEQSNRQLKRMQSLSKQSLVTQEGLEAAENKANQAQSDLASARARLVEARQQMEKTDVKAPFSGVVATRKVSAGDTAQIGKGLMVLIDPASIRFEGYVAADRVGQVKVGNKVTFKVNGYSGQFFTGTVERINPLANESTRQVQLLVAMELKEQSLVAGLYAEGHVEAQNSDALMVPESALIREGDKNFVWQFANNELKKTEVKLGDKDERWGTQQVLSGIVSGAQILRHPQGALTDGGKAELASAPQVSSVQTSAKVSTGN